MSSEEHCHSCYMTFSYPQKFCEPYAASSPKSAVLQLHCVIKQCYMNEQQIWLRMMLLESEVSSHWPQLTS